MPRALRRTVEASELDTAPLIWSFMVASASMNLLTVEPVPTPTISPGTTYWRAAWPTRALSSSWVMVRALRQLQKRPAIIQDVPDPLRPRPPLPVQDGPRRGACTHAGRPLAHPEHTAGPFLPATFCF